MCGITGIFHTSGQPVDAELLVRMRDTMAHRGPDGAGCWISADRRVGLAHRRLAIVDLDPTANQPMANEDGSIQVVFNGEIYNHAEIRTELIKKGGHVWRTDHSDTEVILHAYEEWGVESIHRFNGMFAIALWDQKQRRLWLARDPVGIKPLYYTQSKGRYLFASEIKALLADPAVLRAVDHEALTDALALLTTPAPRTLFRGIGKLPAATWMMISDSGACTTRRYWDLLDAPPPPPLRSIDEAGDLILDKLRTSVRMRKMSDVPMGVFLSGGLDSSSNAALFAEGETRPINTFCVGYAGRFRSYQNENDQAREVATRLGAIHHERYLTQDQLYDSFQRIVHLQDEPLADPVCFPLHELSRLARDNQVKVCQVGEGADELFYGYDGWLRMAHLEQVAARPGRRALMRTAARACGLTRYRDSIQREWISRLGQGQPAFWTGAEGLPLSVRTRILSSDLRHELRGYSPWSGIEPLYRHFQAKCREPHPLHWMTYMDLHLRLPELLLMRVDKMTMGVGLEARVPFLDRAFIECVFGLPLALKQFGSDSKPLLRHAVRTLLPPEVTRRAKRGFGVPVKEWAGGELGALAADIVPRFCRESGLLDEREALDLGTRHRGSRTWMILNLAFWWEQYIKRSPSEHVYQR